MRCLLTFILITTMSISGSAQYEFEPSPGYPFGRANPSAPKALLDYAPMIGQSVCQSASRNPDQSWAEPIEMTWNWKYIMNGLAVQDESLKSDGGHSGSIRQYIADSTRWFVHYYSSNRPSTTLSTWEGNKAADGNIVLYRDNKAPNGMEGDYRLTFYDITDDSFKWIGEWVDKDGTNNFPTWKIDCKKKE